MKIPIGTDHCCVENSQISNKPISVPVHCWFLNFTPNGLLETTLVFVEHFDSSKKVNFQINFIVRISISKLLVLQCDFFLFIFCFLINLTAMFKTDGQLVDGTICDYQFQHGFSNNQIGTLNHSSNSSQNLYRRSQRGYFFSPNYPSTYPSPIQCSYRFSSTDPNNRIRLLFVDVDLYRSDQRRVDSVEKMFPIL